MGRRIAALALLIPAVLWAAKPFPPSPRSYVHNESVVSAGAEQRLSQTLRGFEQATGHQFVVALFQSLDGESLEDYTNKLFREWKIGSAKGNDGVLFALYKNDRKWRVEVGYGVEGVITDLQAGSIARDYGVPHFKSGDFDGGVQAIVDALIARMKGGDLPPSPKHSDAGIPIGLIIMVFYLVMMLVQYFMIWTVGPKARHSGWFFIDLTQGGSGGGSGSGWSSGGGGGGFSGGGGSSGGGGASGGW
jgi:uncharacterized protein